MNKDLGKFLDSIADILVEQDLKNPPEAPADSNPPTTEKDSTSSQLVDSVQNPRTQHFSTENP